MSEQPRRPLPRTRRTRKPNALSTTYVRLVERARSSPPCSEPSRYDVVVDDAVADEAVRLLGRLQTTGAGGRPAHT
ncbi:hypothetical protein [Streptomyces sp. NPDC021212]|uniref:hypothetical protein n=1 Tax=Streptomyces sp. NPDC021212 TaxID=3365118 RepID=UPI0037958467